MPHQLVKQQSAVHGWGIVAAEKISKNEIFYTVPLEKVYHSPRPGCAFIGNNKWVDDPEVLNNINHSCDPNTRLDLYNNQPALKAIRTIDPGEEITCDYNETEINGKRIPCLCNATQCRGYFLRIE